MKSWLRICMPLVLGVALLAAPVSSASAQSSDSDALLVVSIASIDDQLDHLDYLLEVAGVEEFGTVARMMTAPFTEVIDNTMPIGALALKARCHSPGITASACRTWTMPTLPTTPAG